MSVIESLLHALENIKIASTVAQVLGIFGFAAISKTAFPVTAV